VLVGEGVQQVRKSSIAGAEVQLLVINTPIEQFIFITESEEASYEILSAFIKKTWPERFNEPIPDDIDIAFEAFFDDGDGLPKDTYDFYMYPAIVIREKSQETSKSVTVESISSLINN
jgi:hypothetical protein